ncbi:MAG: hypothetical protein ABSF09_07575 [Candidatus Bathyarchaeia archaeon]
MNLINRQQSNGTLRDGPVHVETNASFNNYTKVATWQFSFYAIFHAFGASEFYPYDSWLLNLTTSSPILSMAKLNNISGDLLSSDAPGWDTTLGSCSQTSGNLVSGGLSYCFHLDRDSLNVSILLRRAAFQTLPIRYMPIVMFLILGASVLIPQDDLASKTTVYTSLIFFVGALLLNISSSLPPRSFAFSFAEAALYNILFLAAAFLVESIFEKILPVTDFYVDNRFNRFRHFYLIPLMRVALLAITFLTVYSYTNGYQGITRYYSWVDMSFFETFFLPVSASSLWIIIGVILSILSAKDEFRKDFRRAKRLVLLSFRN